MERPIPYNPETRRTPPNLQPHAVCLELPGDLSEAEVRKLVRDLIAATWKHRSVAVQELWMRRYDPQVGSPVFYIP